MSTTFGIKYQIRNLCTRIIGATNAIYGFKTYVVVYYHSGIQRGYVKYTHVLIFSRRRFHNPATNISGSFLGIALVRVLFNIIFLFYIFLVLYPLFSFQFFLFLIYNFFTKILYLPVRICPRPSSRIVSSPSIALLIVSKSFELYAPL